MTELTSSSDQPTGRRPIDRLFREYGADHQNPLNVAIHCIAVPLIAWSTLALVGSIPLPGFLEFIPGFDLAWIVAALGVAYYASLGSPGITIAMAVAAVGYIVSFEAYPDNALLSLPVFALVIFAVAWVLQFIGHAIEGRRPSFLHDLQFLLIGPAWVAGHIFNWFGWKW